jgi:hypothetical protein
MWTGADLRTMIEQAFYQQRPSPILHGPRRCMILSCLVESQLGLLRWSIGSWYRYRRYAQLGWE